MTWHLWWVVASVTLTAHEIEFGARLGAHAALSVVNGAEAAAVVEQTPALIVC